MPVTLEVSGLKAAAQELDLLPQTMAAGVKVSGPAAEYALVWEWGSARLQKPGPKTTWGVNPSGERAILTITAPSGYIRVNREHYLAFVREEFQLIHWPSVGLEGIEAALVEMFHRAALRCAELIRDTAPEDTGQLKSNIVPADVGDALLQEVDLSTQGFLSFGPELNLGGSWF